MERIGESTKNTNELIPIYQDFSPPYYLHREENGIELKRKVEVLKKKRVDLLTKNISELTSGKTLKTECRLWLTNVENIVKEAENLENKLAEGRFMEYEASGRILMRKMEELDELYRKGKFAESLVAEEKAEEKSQSSSQSKTKKKENSSGEANEGGKISIVGMGGVGDTRIENKSPVNFTYGNIQL